ncbi:MAG: DUF4476 domain-containing protein, partial [Crocinitomicaceae bacterium]|nr:DUF4476 domain-containing protein [Crocinitomicaceae bacterium]
LLSMEPTHGALQQTGVVYYRQDNYAVYSDAPVTTQIVSPTSPVQSNQTNMQVSENQQQNTMNTNGQVNGNVNLNMNVGLNAGMNTNSSSSTTTTTTSSTTSSQSNSENINMNVNFGVNATGMATQTENVNMNTGINGSGTQMQSETINLNVGMNINGVNTTTQSSASNVNVGVSTTVPPANVNGSGSNSNYNNNENYTYNQSNNVSQQTISTTGNCTKTFTDLQDYLADLKSITFEEDKVETIKKDFAATCLMANQAVEIVKTLTFEANRYEIATYLYDRMFDKNNGRLITPLFTFEATKNDYRDYMRK